MELAMNSGPIAPCTNTFFILFFSIISKFKQVETIVRINGDMHPANKVKVSSCIPLRPHKLLPISTKPLKDPDTLAF
jgi:hypothetical protein